MKLSQEFPSKLKKCVCLDLFLFYKRKKNVCFKTTFVDELLLFLCSVIFWRKVSVILVQTAVSQSIIHHFKLFLSDSVFIRKVLRLHTIRKNALATLLRCSKFNKFLKVFLKGAAAQWYSQHTSVLEVTAPAPAPTIIQLLWLKISHNLGDLA